MKTGVILYIVGGEGPYDDLDMEEAVRKLDIKADGVETVFGRSPHFDVMDAWWRLTAKGMKKRSYVCLPRPPMTQNSGSRAGNFDCVDEVCRAEKLSRP